MAQSSEIKYLVVRDKIKERKTVTENIDTEAMIVDPLTKDLAPTLFNEHVVNMRLELF